MLGSSPPKGEGTNTSSINARSISFTLEVVVILLSVGENCQRIQRIHPERIHREQIKRIRPGQVRTPQLIKIASERGSDTSGEIKTKGVQKIALALLF